MKSHLLRSLALVASLTLLGVLTTASRAAEPPTNTQLYLPLVMQRSHLPPPDELQRVGQFGGGASAVAVNGSLAYVALGPQLVVFDVADPAAPHPVGDPLWLGYDRVSDIVVAGQYAYLAGGPTGIHILDLATPSAPRAVAIYDTPGLASAIDIVGSLAYVADYQGGLRILDLTQPTAPVEVGHYDADNLYFNDVAVVGRYAYIADQNSGLWILDVSTPAAPTRVSHLEAQSDAVALTVVGHYVYIVDDDYGLGIIDVSDPTQPEQVGGVRLNTSVDVDIVGHYALVAGSRLRVVDITDPTNPTRVATYETGATMTQVMGDKAYLASYAGFQILNVSEPSSPALIGASTSPSSPTRIWVSGATAYLAGDGRGLHVVDVARSERAMEVANYPQWSPNDMMIVGHLAYITDGEGLRILDVTDARHVHEVGFYKAPVYSEGVWVEGHYAYVADGQAGLRIVDVTNPAAPREVGAFALPNPETRSFNAVKVVGSYAYLTGNGFWVIDVSDPTASRQVGFYGVYSNVVDVQGNRAYLQANPAGLRILDVSNPAAPTLLATYVMSDSTADLQVVGRYAYLANYDQGLRVVDVADPNRVREVAYYDPPSPADVRGVDVQDGLVYLAAETNGLLVVRAMGE